VTRRRGRRRSNLLDDLKDRTGYSHLKVEALDRTMWRHRFGGGFGPVVRQNTEWMKFATFTTHRHDLLPLFVHVFFKCIYNTPYLRPHTLYCFCVWICRKEWDISLHFAVVYHHFIVSSVQPVRAKFITLASSKLFYKR